MARRIVMMLALVTGLSAFASPLRASDPTFPIGIWVYDYGAPYFLSRPTWLAALRWQGINVGPAGGTVADCRQRLATYDSVGGRDLPPKYVPPSVLLFSCCFGYLGV